MTQAETSGSLDLLADHTEDCVDGDLKEPLIGSTVRPFVCAMFCGVRIVTFKIVSLF